MVGHNEQRIALETVAHHPLQCFQRMRMTAEAAHAALATLALDIDKCRLGVRLTVMYLGAERAPGGIRDDLVELAVVGGLRFPARLGWLQDSGG